MLAGHLAQLTLPLDKVGLIGLFGSFICRMQQPNAELLFSERQLLVWRLMFITLMETYLRFHIFFRAVFHVVALHVKPQKPLCCKVRRPAVVRSNPRDGVSTCCLSRQLSGSKACKNASK